MTPPPPADDDCCPNCGGDGVIYMCMDEIGCIDPESGCDLCERKCDWCEGKGPMTSLPPAVVATLKAADEMARASIRTGTDWCQGCHRDIGDGFPHGDACPVGRYLATRKEIEL